MRIGNGCSIVHVLPGLTSICMFIASFLHGALEKRHTNTIHAFTSNNMQWVSSNNYKMKECHKLYRSTALNLQFNVMTTTYSLLSDVTAT